MRISDWSSDVCSSDLATEAINLVAYSWGEKFLQPGDEVLISHMEHHANIVPWQLLRDRRGIVLKVAPVNDRGELIWDDFVALIGPNTKLVAITHVSNTLGTRSEEHTSELQSLMRISYAAFCLHKKPHRTSTGTTT